MQKQQGKGADVNIKDNRGDTASMWAAWHGHTEVVELLKSKESTQKNNEKLCIVQ